MTENKIVLRGIVLRRTDTGETDKILTVLTAEGGKLRVIARGARRKNSRVAAVSQLLAYSELTLYRRREWYLLDEGSSIELFAGLQKDLERLSLGMYFAELTDALTQEDVPAGDALSLLLNALYALDKLQKPPALVKAVFELRALSLGGYEPLVNGCAICGRAQPIEPVFDAAEGILRCRSCGAVHGGEALSPEAVMGLRRSVYGDAKRLYSFSLTGAPLQQLAALAERFVQVQLEREFSTLDFYKSLNSPFLR